MGARPPALATRALRYRTHCPYLGLPREPGPLIVGPDHRRHINGLGEHTLLGAYAVGEGPDYLGARGSAQNLVEESEVHEPWERCVQLLLRLRCDQEAEGVEELVETTQGLETPLFATRAVLTVFPLLARDRTLADKLLLRMSETGYAVRGLLDDTRADLGESSGSACRGCARRQDSGRTPWQMSS